MQGLLKILKRIPIGFHTAILEAGQCVNTSPMKVRIHLLAIFYRSFGYYLWAIPVAAWLALGAPTGRNLYVSVPALIFFKLFLQGVTVYIVQRKYAHQFFFYANANLSRTTLFAVAFVADFVAFALSISLIQLASDL
nr:hypothetical protein [uncultured Dyadobacter sp.]